MDTSILEVHMEQCEWCGKDAPNGTFFVTHGFSEGPFKVGECCGERDTELIKPEHRGPLLTKKAD